MHDSDSLVSLFGAITLWNYVTIITADGGREGKWELTRGLPGLHKGPSGQGASSGENGMVGKSPQQVLQSIISFCFVCLERGRAETTATENTDLHVLTTAIIKIKKSRLSRRFV